jgi:hypothetical protein
MFALRQRTGQLRLAVHIGFGIGIFKGMKKGIRPKVFKIAIIDGGVPGNQIDVVPIARPGYRRRIKSSSVNTRIIAAVLPYKFLCKSIFTASKSH